MCNRLAFGRGTLRATKTRLKFQRAVHRLTADEGDDFFKATRVAHGFG